MWLYITLNLKSSQREKYLFSLFSEEIEPQLEVLNYLILCGYRPLSAYFVDDEGKRTVLPIEAFDGLSVADSLQALQTEYQKILNP